MKTLFFENKFEVNRVDNEIEKLQKDLKELLSDWQEMTKEYLGNPAPLNMEILRSFYDSKGIPIESKIENHLLNLKARERKTKYPDFDIDELKRILNRPIVGMLLYSLEAITPNQYWQCLEISGKKITTNSEQIEFIKDQFREYAETETEHKRLELAKKVVENMKVILKEFPHVAANDFNLPKFTFVSEGEICISYHWVKFGRLNSAMLQGDNLRTFAKRKEGDNILKPTEPRQIDL